VKIHIVQKGDTLWKIAKKYGVNFEELKKMNTQLSNPDMIMPGMKIKVPTAGGTIKKESPIGGLAAKINMGSKKEMPIKELPIVKEQPIIKEQPIVKEMPIKEVPIKEVPIKQVPIKEVPKTPFIPKMPMPIMPEIDINNYYMMNMANMQVQQPQPPPPMPMPAPPPMPEIKEMPIESFEQPIMEKPVEGGITQPMYPCPPNPCPPVPCAPQFMYPISPVLPGSGLPCPPEYTYPAAAPYAQQVMPQMPGTMMPQMPGAMMPQMPGTMMPQGQMMMPGMEVPAAMPFMEDESTALPLNPNFPQTAPMMGMPYGYPQQNYYPVSPVLPGTGLPLGQMQYGAGYPMGGYPMGRIESPDMMPQQMATAVPQQMPTGNFPPTVTGTSDCGCGRPMDQQMGAQFPHGGMAFPQTGAQFPHGGMAFPQTGAQFSHGGMAFPQTGAQFPQGGMAFPQTGMQFPHGGMTFPQTGTQFSQGMAFPQTGMQFPQGGMAFPQGGMQFPQGGMSFPQGGTQFPEGSMTQLHSDETSMHGGMPFTQAGSQFPQGGMPYPHGSQVYTPSFGQQGITQPPYMMNPYGFAPMRNEFLMPRVDDFDESSEYEG
jgi:morphogenetic protein associated with SpoVID